MNFNTKQICRITGLTIRQVDYWDRSHFIKPSLKEASGPGSSRLYTFSDLVQIKMTKTLLDGGVTLQKIRKSVNYLKKHFPDVKKPLAEMKFITDGETIFVLTRDKRVILDTLSKGQMVFALAIGEIIDELKGDLARMGQERSYKVSVRGKLYKVILRRDIMDGVFRVECPSLPGCASQGETVEEALMQIQEAIPDYVKRSSGKGRRRRKGAVA